MKKERSRGSFNIQKGEELSVFVLCAALEEGKEGERIMFLSLQPKNIQ